MTIDVNIKTTDYSDVTLDLVKKHHTPYSKPNNIPLYVQKESNHPPSVLKNIPEPINHRLCDISTNDPIFSNANPQYQDASAKSRYNYQLKCKDYSNNTNTSIKPIGQRRVIWYNLPYSRNAKTKIGSIFLKLIKDIFHTKHPLHKIFNKNTLKLSYSCCSNLEQTITAHNKSVTKNNTALILQAGCNYRNGETCPENGHSQTLCTRPMYPSHQAMLPKHM